MTITLQNNGRVWSMYMLYNQHQPRKANTGPSWPMRKSSPLPKEGLRTAAEWFYLVVQFAENVSCQLKSKYVGTIETVRQSVLQ